MILIIVQNHKQEAKVLIPFFEMRFTSATTGIHAICLIVFVKQENGNNIKKGLISL